MKNNWLRDTLVSSFTPKKRKNIVEWLESPGLNLPANTAEPGKLKVERTPYMKEILKRMSPDDPTRELILVFGSQMGKTTIENAIMCYFIEEDPSPMAFAFSDDSNLAGYIKNKFDPLLAANPRIKSLLRTEGSGKADSMTSKIFPGGFIKFLSGKSESSMRSDSVRIVIADEVDGMGLTKGGDPRSLLRKRTNTFKDRSKMCMSSTPLNDSMIYSYLKESTFNKYYVPCPCCGKMINLSRDTLRWSLIEDTVTVDDAWMECPECKGVIRNEDKITMYDKGEWRPTNLKADPSIQGYYLPSYLAPVGWISWKDCAKELVEALNAPEDEKETKLISYTNTIDAMPYAKGGVDEQAWKETYDKAKKSKYERGRIPSWVNFLTTGSDVQKNRFEISLYGWGKMGHSIAIDHWFIPIGDNEIDDPNSPAWYALTDSVLKSDFTRDDGLHMQTIANAIDSSYETENINNWWRFLPNELKDRMYIVRGRVNLEGLLPIRKDIKRKNGGDIFFWGVPVTDLKHNLFDHLKSSLEPKKDMPFLMEFPNNFSAEYYQQLYSEQWVKEKGKKKWEWVKIRDRNEILDCTVYNLAMFYHMGFGRWTAEQWDAFDRQQKISATTLAEMSLSSQKRRGRRVLSQGLKI
jgi:phage terminase large subunit GpA-like protein